MIFEPARRARVNAPRTNGVMPLADTPMTTSRLVGSSRFTDRAPFLVVVLDAFLRAQHRVLAAGHDREDEIGVGAEGGRHLGRFEDAEASAGAGAHEHDAAAVAQRLR